jgi:tRNA(fMet)-specific endonuclease VapC
MVFDTNLLIEHIRRQEMLPARAVIPVIVAGELEAFALKADWGYQKVSFMQRLFERFPIVEVIREITTFYARIDAYSQGNLQGQPLPPGLSARNMGKNDIWIAATALYLDLELHTTDNDFNHLPPLGLRLVKDK